MSRTSSDRQSEILDAVVSVIIDVGFTEMTVGHVARRAGVSTALVHYHFSSKDELITAAIRAASQTDREYRRRIADRPTTALSRLDAMLCGSLPESSEDASWLLWIETWSETRRNAALRAVMADLESDEFGMILELVTAGSAAGEFTCDDHGASTARLLAVRDGLAISQTLFDDGSEPDKYVDRLGGAICLELGLAADDYRALAHR